MSDKPNPKHLSLRKKIAKQTNFATALVKNARVQNSKSIQNGVHYAVSFVNPRTEHELAAQSMYILRQELRNYTMNDFKQFEKEQNSFYVSVLVTPVFKLEIHVDKIVIASIAVKVFDDGVQIFALACNQYFKRSGFGKVLVASVLNKYNVPISCVSDEESAAFYERIGFVCLSKQPNMLPFFQRSLKEAGKDARLCYGRDVTPRLDAEVKLQLTLFKTAVNSINASLKNIRWCVDMYTALDEVLKTNPRLAKKIDNMKEIVMQESFDDNFLDFDKFMAATQKLEDMQDILELINKKMRN